MISARWNGLCSASGKRPAFIKKPLERVSAAAEQGLCFLLRTFKFVRPLLGPRACRFAPSCTDYALEAVSLHGPARGLLLAARRIARCHPFSPGGLDPVPR
ncbi:MAG: membrane protein insertion efficiency factor YidD [Elusimicrobiales bacterium]|nr:membrane protein insertion efficiency factor YidD [Elusimicrobiales bacterium]